MSSARCKQALEALRHAVARAELAEPPLPSAPAPSSPSSPQVQLANTARWSSESREWSQVKIWSEELYPRKDGRIEPDSIFGGGWGIALMLPLFEHLLRDETDAEDMRAFSIGFAEDLTKAIIEKCAFVKVEDAPQSPAAEGDQQSEIEGQDAVKEEELDFPPTPPNEVVTLDPKYGRDQPTQSTPRVLLPHSSTLPDFPSIPNRLAAHPLDRRSWFDPALTLPPPTHLLEIDDGNSLFDVNFSRQQPDDLNGSTGTDLAPNAKLYLKNEWNGPTPQEIGGPYCIVERPIPSNERLTTALEVKDFMSIFYGGGSHPNWSKSWRYRGDIVIHQRIYITREHFARMGPEEKEQWIEYLRFENSARRCAGLENKLSPVATFESFTKPDAIGVVLTILKVVGYDEDRIKSWLENRRKRLIDPDWLKEEKEAKKEAKKTAKALEKAEKASQKLKEVDPNRGARTRLRSAAPGPGVDEKPSKQIKLER